MLGPVTSPLAAPPALACQPPALDVSVPGWYTDPAGTHTASDAHDANQDMVIPKLLKVHLDLLVAALATDAVRVAVLQLGDNIDWQWSMPWLGFQNAVHANAHDDNAAKLAQDTWIYGQWAYFIGQLKSQQEGSKSILDNSVVAFMNGMTTGGHQWQDVPAFLAGSCGGYFKMWRAVTNRVSGQVHNPLLVSIANAMGMPPPDNAWGDPRYNSGEMPGLRG
jgi:hypothetical protein